MTRWALHLALAVGGTVGCPAAQAAPAVDALPYSDVVRLTDEARALLGETKGLAQRTTSSRPIGIDADSLHAYDAIHYRLDVTPSRSSNQLTGTMTLDLVVRDPGFTTIDLHDEGLTINAVRVNAEPRGFTESAGMLLIPACGGGPCPPHGVGDTLHVEVEYAAVGQPLGFYYYPRNSYTFTEPYDARFWMPCWDLPFDKATLDVYATVPDSNVCVSNGVLLSVTPGAPGTQVYHWQETHPLATYLMAVTVGNFWQWTQTSGSIPILQNVFPEDSTKAKFDFANMPAMIPAFAAHWGPYAFDKYGQVAVTPFGAGGMEHQSMTTINRSWVRGDRTLEGGMAHELAHQWWGDMVTCVDFRNIWLNEGFASFGECQWQEAFYGAAAYASIVQAQMTSALNSDANFRYRLYDPPEANLFGNTIYKKGSLVLHMLRRVLGDATFDAGMQLYGQRFRYGNASTADYHQAMEDVSGQDLDWYFNEWVYDQGLPTYNWWWQLDATSVPGESHLGISIRQVQTNAPLFRMPIEFRVTRTGKSDTTLNVMNEALVKQAFVFNVAGTITNVVFDPRNSIYKRIALAAADVPAVIPETGPAIALAAAPNPARGSSTLRVRLGAPTSRATELRIFDSSGRSVRSLGRSRAGAVESEFVWNLRDDAGRRVAPGYYFAQARVGEQHEERAIVVMP